MPLSKGEQACIWPGEARAEGCDVSWEIQMVSWLRQKPDCPTEKVRCSLFFGHHLGSRVDTATTTRVTAFPWAHRPTALGRSPRPSHARSFPEPAARRGGRGFRFGNQSDFEKGYRRVLGADFAVRCPANHLETARFHAHRAPGRAC